MRFGRRDHESYIGGYDPEREMPDPSRDPRGRWQSDAYRHNARDSRWGYRWDPDRVEERHGDYRGDFSERIGPRDRYEPRYESRPDYDYGYDRDRGYYDRDYIRDYERRRHAYESPNRENWSGEDFDRTWDYGRGDEERARALRPDRGYEHGRTYGVYGNMRDWDRRPDGERYPSDWGWGQSGREWEHSRDWDERGRRRRW